VCVWCGGVGVGGGVGGWGGGEGWCVCVWGGVAWPSCVAGWCGCANFPRPCQARWRRRCRSPSMCASAKSTVDSSARQASARPPPGPGASPSAGGAAAARHSGPSRRGTVASHTFRWAG
jgi:hypothetical protein